MASLPAVSTFVKSWNTKVASAKSRLALEGLLRRYGASGFTISEDYRGRTAVVSFNIPRSFQFQGDAADHIEIRIPVSYAEVQRRLDTISAFRNLAAEKKEAQSERVAWRHILLLTEAALMAAALGVQTPEEAFFAHAVQELPGIANKMRTIDAFTVARRQLGSGK